MPDKNKEKVRKISQGVKKRYTRRDFLKTAGAAAGLGAASAFGITNFIGQKKPNHQNTSTAAATGNQDYEIIEVGAGETFRKSLSDGETWENKLIDISANGAGYDITARGSGWEIRNIGITGSWTKDGSPFRVEVPDSNGEGLIENVHIGLENDISSPYDNGPTGIYVWGTHAGHIEINRAWVEGTGDNGLYASSPGHDPSYPSYDPGGGDVVIKNSRFQDDNVPLRLGTDGSRAENCVVAGSISRGFWAYQRHSECINCDFLNNDPADIALGHGNNDAGHNAEVTMTNCRWETETKHGNNNQIHGDSQGQPQDRIPEGTPTTPEEAAFGTSNATGRTGSNGTADPLEDIDTSPGEHTITLKGGSQNDPKNYIIEAENLEKQQGNGKILGNTATGTLTGQTTHKYRYNGHIHDIRLQKGITITYDSKQLTQPQITALCQNTTTETGSGDANTGGTTCTPGGDYETIQVSAGDTFSKNLSDGETWENKIIDVTANNATFSINASASSWKIRNIGVRGQSGENSDFLVRVTDSNGEGLIENVYIDNFPGVYVYWNHKGVLKFNNVTFLNNTDNAIYGSPPGNGNGHPKPGEGGDVHVTNSYFEGSGDIDATGIRLGTDGSYAKNCVCWNMVRGIWQYYENSEYINCDIGNNNTDVVVSHGDGSWEKQSTAEATMTNTRWETTNSHPSVQSRINGSPTGTPKHRQPEELGAPTSAEDAASCE